MWEAIKNFFAGMFSSKIEIDKPLELPRYDSKQLKRELEIEKKQKKMVLLIFHLTPLKKL